MQPPRSPRRAPRWLPAAAVTALAVGVGGVWWHHTGAPTTISGVAYDPSPSSTATDDASSEATGSGDAGDADGTDDASASGGSATSGDDASSTAGASRLSSKGSTKRRATAGSSAAPVITGRTVSATSAGAAGDGKTDDTAALQAALDALSSGDALSLPAGKVFAHSGVLHLRVPGTSIVGSGTLRATDPANSALWMEGDDTRVVGISIEVAGATTRLGTWNDVGLRVANTSGSLVQDVSVTGGASAGVMVDGSDRFTLRRVSVSGTLADGIHVTDASHDGLLDHVTTSRTGDDGVAVVSYKNLPQVHDITVTSPTVEGTTWGRGISDVGGKDITYTDVSVTGSNAAALYIAAETSWNTYASSAVTVTGGVLDDSNTSATVDHGAVLLYNGDPAQTLSGVTITGLKIKDTNPARSREVGIIGDSDAPVVGVVMKDITITGSGPATFSTNTTGAHYALSGWTRDGKAVPASSR